MTRAEVGTSRAVECKKKRCRTCKQEKPVEEFARQRSTHDGLSGACRSCVRAIRDQLHNPETVDAEFADACRRSGNI